MQHSVSTRGGLCKEGETHHCSPSLLQAPRLPPALGTVPLPGPRSAATARLRRRRQTEQTEQQDHLGQRRKDGRGWDWRQKNQEFNSYPSGL